MIIPYSHGNSVIALRSRGSAPGMTRHVGGEGPGVRGTCRRRRCGEREELHRDRAARAAARPALCHRRRKESGRDRRPTLLDRDEGEPQPHQVQEVLAPRSGVHSCISIPVTRLKVGAREEHHHLIVLRRRVEVDSPRRSTGPRCDRGRDPRPGDDLRHEDRHHAAGDQRGDEVVQQQRSGQRAGNAYVLWVTVGGILSSLRLLCRGSGHRGPLLQSFSGVEQAAGIEGPFHAVLELP